MRTIHKVVGIVIQNNELLMVRNVGKNIWTGLGGKPEQGESEEQALVREIQEEIGCEATIGKKIGDFTDKAIFDDAMVKLSVYMVNLEGMPTLQDDELEEMMFMPHDYRDQDITLSPSITNDVIPKLIQDGHLTW